MEKKSFVMYCSFWKPIEHLSDEQLGRLFRAIFIYQTEGEEVEVSQDIAVAYYFMVNQFNIDKKKYERIVEARTSAGRKGGRRTQENNRVNRANQANADFAQANQPDYVMNCVDGANVPPLEELTNVSLSVNECDGLEDDPVAREKNQELIFLKELFFDKNITGAHNEVRLFINYYNERGWKTKDGYKLDNIGKRINKLRMWSIQKINTPNRFPQKFLKAWFHLWCAAPDDLKMLMMEDKIVIDTQYTPEVVVHPEVAKWLTGDGSGFKAGILDGEWQGGRKVRIMTYVPETSFEIPTN